MSQKNGYIFVYVAFYIYFFCFLIVVLFKFILKANRLFMAGPIVATYPQSYCIIIYIILYLLFY